MKTTTLTLIFFLFLLVLPSAYSIQINDPGVKPNSWLYDVDKFFEKTKLAFTFDAQKRAESGLEQAYERLNELNQLIIDGNLDVDKYQNDYINTIRKVSEDVYKIDGNPENEIQKGVEVELLVLEHKLYLDSLRDDNDGLSISQIEKKEEIIASFLKEIDELDNKIKIKEQNAIIKLKAVEKKDVNDIVYEKRKNMGVLDIEKQITEQRVGRVLNKTNSEELQEKLSFAMKYPNSIDSKKRINEVESLVL